MNWTLDADRILRILVDCGTHVDVIAEEFGCGVGEIVRRIRELKLPAVAAVDWVAGEKARCQLCEVELEEVDVHGCEFASKTGDEEVTILKFDCVCARCLLIVEEEVRKKRPTSRTATPTKIYHSRGLVQLSRRRAQFCPADRRKRRITFAFITSVYRWYTNQARAAPRRSLPISPPA